MHDKEHLFVIGVLGVFVKANVGPKLRREAAHGLGPAIPLQVEPKDVTTREVIAFAVRCRDWSSMVFRPEASAAAAALLADPEQ